MNGLTRIALLSLVTCGAAQAQQWQTFTYPNPGVAIQFPAVPEVQTSQFRNAAGVTLPVTQYAVRQEGVQYTLSVVNYSSTNADALGTVGAGGGSGSDHSGGGGNTEHTRTVANQRPDSACVGKSAGDTVQLETPTGPVPATCTLTARPNPPASGKPQDNKP